MIASSLLYNLKNDDSKKDKEVRRLPSGFSDESVCIPNFVAASDRIRIENSGDDGVSYDS